MTPLTDGVRTCSPALALRSTMLKSCSEVSAVASGLIATETVCRPSWVKVSVPEVGPVKSLASAPVPVKSSAHSTVEVPETPPARTTSKR